MDVIGFIFAVTIIVSFAFVASKNRKKNLSILIKSLLRLYRDDYINDKNTNVEFQLKTSENQVFSKYISLLPATLSKARFKASKSQKRRSIRVSKPLNLVYFLIFVLCYLF